MKRRKSMLALLCALLLLTMLSACGEQAKAPYAVPDAMESLASGTAAANDRFSLEWQNEAKCVLLRDRQSDQVWATTPYEYLLSGEVNYSLNSPLVIEYYDWTDGSVQIAKAYECVEEESVSVRKGEQGIRVTYYFRQAEITVTVAYALREDSLKVSLHTSDFAESGKTQLISVSVAPYLCAAANTKDRSSYLFIPSGSGALMYTDEEAVDIPRAFSGEVYGADPSRTQLDHPGEEEPIRLPVFGVKAGENALCAIIESGDGAARVDASAGSPRHGYSNAYATFYVRGFNNVEWNAGAGTKDAILLSEAWPQDREFSVGYYPLTGKDADYNGMAACYRRYLQDSGALEKSGQEQMPYQLNLIGGAQTQAYTLGIPHRAFLPLTTFEQARLMAGELEKLTGQTPALALLGFGKSGMETGPIAGGFAFAGDLGGAKRQRELEAFCKKENIPLFTDFDLVRFSESGNGFSVSFDTAYAADSQPAAYFPLKRNVRAEDTKRSRIRLLERSALGAAAEKLLRFSENRLSGISLSSYGQTAYSDYREDAYMLKGDLTGQTQSIVKAMRGAGHPLLLSAANAYAAGLADSLSDVPLQNGSYDALDETVPFYQMVFRGAIPLYSTALNLSPNPERELLRAVEAGVSPAFTLCYAADEALADASGSFYYGILYENNKERLAQAVRKTAELYERIKGAGIRSHRILEEEVTQTVFDNGVIVTINHSDKDVTADGRILPARSFRY